MVLRKLPREALLDSVDLFRRLDLKAEPKPLDSDGRVDTFIHEVRASLTSSLATESTVRGWRAQSLFASLVVALDACDLMTTVDIGDVYYDGDPIKPADFFLHLRGGQRMLVDVKDVSLRTPGDMLKRPIKFAVSEVKRLRSFAERFGAEPYLALYFGEISQWSLIALDDLEVGPGGGYRVSPSSAFMRSRMAMLGDQTIGAEWPLEIAIAPDSTEPNHVDEEGRVSFTISAVHMRVGGREILSEIERRIVWFFMMYGHWEQEERAVVHDSKLIEVQWIATPQEPAHRWEVIGSLSGMYSTLFESSTSGPDGFTALDLGIDPGTITTLIPHDYNSQELPLWRLELVPNVEVGHGTPAATNPSTSRRPPRAARADAATRG